MDMADYHQKYGRSGLDRLAERMGTSAAYLSQIAHGHRWASWKFCQRLEEATEGEVTCQHQRPDIFGSPHVNREAS